MSQNLADFFYQSIQSYSHWIAIMQIFSAILRRVILISRVIQIFFYCDCIFLNKCIKSVYILKIRNFKIAINIMQSFVFLLTNDWLVLNKCHSCLTWLNWVLIEAYLIILISQWTHGVGAERWLIAFIHENEDEIIRKYQMAHSRSSYLCNCTEEFYFI